MKLFWGTQTTDLPFWFQVLLVCAFIAAAVKYV